MHFHFPSPFSMTLTLPSLTATQTVSLPPALPRAQTSSTRLFDPVDISETLRPFSSYSHTMWWWVENKKKWPEGDTVILGSSVGGNREGSERGVMLGLLSFWGIDARVIPLSWTRTAAAIVAR